MTLQLEDLLEVGNKELSEERDRCVVRLRTSSWSDKNGINTKRSLTFLRRKCKGYNMLEEDASMIGAEEVIPNIINLDACRDGVYEVVSCNESRDWETGIVDDYDYKLIKYDA